MEFDKIKELIEAVSKSNLTRFEMKEGNLKISMRTDKDGKNVILTSPESAVAVPAVPAERARRERRAGKRKCGEISAGGNFLLCAQ